MHGEVRFILSTFIHLARLGRAGRAALSPSSIEKKHRDHLAIDASRDEPQISDDSFASQQQSFVFDIAAFCLSNGAKTIDHAVGTGPFALFVSVEQNESF